MPLAHLDRPFDYLVSAADDEAAQPGVRVRVRFAGRLVGGFLLERVESSEHAKLAYLDRVVSAERVLDPEVARLARAVADRYAGNLGDVLRLAIPPRHARVESQPTPVLPTLQQPGSGFGAAGSVGRGSVVVDSDLGGGRPVEGPPASKISPSRAGRDGEVGEAGADLGQVLPSGGRKVAKIRGLAHHEAPAASRSVPGAPIPGEVGRGGGPDREAEDGRGWGLYPAGGAFLRALEGGRAARAVWAALPGEDWAARIAEAVAATVRAGRGAVVVVPDARDLDRVDRALTEALGAGRHVALNAAAGPAERYRRFLTASRHQVPVVAGTRAAMFAPVAELGLVVIWDDGDDLHAEPRAPYPHAREVLLTRAQLAGCAALVGGYARTGEGQLLLETGWAKEITADRETLRARCPAISPTGDDPQLARDPGAVTARLPSLAWQAARQALQAGAPVLVQVPRRGYLPAIACADCRTPARCPHCAGPLGLAGARAVPTCHWCGRAAAAYTCPTCGGRRLRASVTGARRTAEELGRAFPGAPVRTSGRDEVLDVVPGEPAVVVATPGAEPRAEGGYGAVLLLDTWALLTRSDLRAAEETMRRWLSAAALARPGRAGGRVIVVADGSLAPVQALLRWDPGWFAARELAERRELGFPPAARMASVTGRPEAVAELLDAARLPDGAELLGPVPAGRGPRAAPRPGRTGPEMPAGGRAAGDAEALDAGDDQERMLVRVARGALPELARALHEAAAVRGARKASLPVRIQVDPADLF
nr:primosomal protein N' [Krasilnikovia cinnamomea]